MEEPLNNTLVKRTLLFAVIFLVACAAAWGGGKPETAEKISPQAAFEAVNDGTAILVDVRDEASYNRAHIVGAIHIPFGDVTSRIGELERRGKTVITYCSCPAEETSLAAAIDLASAGFTDVRVLLGGIAAWYEAGYAIKDGPRP